jgi:hypothetical protein
VLIAPALPDSPRLMQEPARRRIAAKRVRLRAG